MCLQNIPFKSVLKNFRNVKRYTNKKYILQLPYSRKNPLNSIKKFSESSGSSKREAIRYDDICIKLGVEYVFYSLNAIH